MSELVQSAPKKTLTLDEKLKVEYCIPAWLKFEQIKSNIAKVKGRLQAFDGLRTDPIALVNFGPSLNQTWEKIREFKFVMTCSGSHKFMVERGVIPTWDINVDPRSHKVGLMGQPQKETEYLVASTCNPKLLDHLSEYNVKLWHIFDNEEEGYRIVPYGEWMVTGGCSVGVRTLTLARFLGFTDLHVFGMDGSFGESGTHASEHPHSPKKSYTLEYEGKQYRTTPSMLEAVKNTWHELDMMKDVSCKFYGEGLVQAMSRKYQRKEITKPVYIGFNKPELISVEYRELNRQLHEQNMAYGVGGGKHAPTVLKLVESLSKHVKFPRVLDYGCGRSYLARELPFAIDEYDPAIPGKDLSPRPADLVVCTDVLEHVERDRIDYVLDDLRRCTKQIGYFVVHTGPSSKVLADGRNSHILQENSDWWKAKLGEFFQIAENSFISKPPLIHIVVAPKKLKSLKQTLVAA